MVRASINPPISRRSTRLVWVTGPSGCGKSYTVGKQVPQDLELRPVKKDAFIKWWPANSNQSDYVLIEDMDTSFNKHTGLNQLKVWGDHYSFNVEFKGGMVEISPAIIVITSNYSLDGIL